MTNTPNANVARAHSWVSARCENCGEGFPPKDFLCQGQHPAVEPHEHVYLLGNDLHCRMCGELPVMAAPEAPGERINHPAHYNAHPSGVECIVIVEHMTFNVGNAVKYLWRAGLKDASPQIEDLKKAAWYLKREIDRLETK
jgi:hypothetical protein